MALAKIIQRSFAILVLVTTLTSVSETMAQTSGGTNPECATLPGSINVWLTSFLSEWPFGTNQYQMGVPFENYTYGIVMGELSTSVPQGQYAGSAWSDEVLKAQSVAARTLAAYWCHNWAFN